MDNKERQAMTEAQEILDKLTEAQKRRFLHPVLAQGWLYKGFLGRPRIAMPADCIEYVTTRPGYEKYRLTPLGLAVRALLEKRT